MPQDSMAEDRLAVALKVRAKVLKDGATAKDILTAPRGTIGQRKRSARVRVGVEWGCRCKSVCRVWLSLRCVSMVYQTVFLDRPDQNGG